MQCYFRMSLYFCFCLCSTSKVMVIVGLFLKLIDSKHQVLWAHNAVCPHVDCKFLLGIVCSYIDLKSVCISLPLHIPSFCVHFLWVLPVSAHHLSHCWLMVLQLLLSSHDLSVMWGNIEGSIFIYFSLTSLMHHDWNQLKLFFCSYRMTFVYAIATWKHRNNAGWTIFHIF